MEEVLKCPSLLSPSSTDFCNWNRVQRLHPSLIKVMPHHPCQALPSFTINLMFIELMMSSNYLIFCHPLLLPSIFPSIRVLSNESALSIRWPTYRSVSFSIIPSKEHPGLISFTMYWLDLLAFQETLKSLLQHHTSSAAILRYSVFFTVQLSHPYMTTGKTVD